MFTNFSLSHGDVALRLIRARDAKTLEALVLDNRAWLKPWEATLPDAPQSFDFKGMARSLLKQYDQRTALPLLIELDGDMVGQLNVANILYGAVSSAVIGYWVAPSAAGRGVTPTAVALAADYLMREMGLHRVEINIVPDNVKSLRVVEKLGFRHEGLKRNYIHINGAWRDHHVFALTKEDLDESILSRWVGGRVPELDQSWRGLS